MGSYTNLSIYYRIYNDLIVFVIKNTSDFGFQMLDRRADRSADFSEIRMLEGIDILHRCSGKNLNVY